jgi:hypothetical protein
MLLEDQLTELFYRHDPVGLAELGAPEDELLARSKGFASSPDRRDFPGAPEADRSFGVSQDVGSGKNLRTGIRLRRYRARDLDEIPCRSAGLPILRQHRGWSAIRNLQSVTTGMVRRLSPWRV